MNTAIPTLHIVDDEPLVLDALRLMLSDKSWNIECFAKAGDFLASINGDILHGCALIDIFLPDINGPDVVSQLMARGITLPVVLMTGQGDVPLAVESLKRGAFEFVTKPVDTSKLKTLVKKAIAVDGENRQERDLTRRAAVCAGKLTPRQTEVMNLVVNGHSTKEIATILGVRPKTIEAHRGMIMSKMEASSVPDLVRRHQLIERCQRGYE
jgi:FixJ family two-component response regulator